MTPLLAACAMAIVQSPAISWIGEPPVTGGIQWIEVTTGTPADTVTGTLDGARLTFTRTDDAWTAAGPVRVSNAVSTLVRVTIQRGRRRSALSRRLPLERRTFPQTRLRVGSQFTTRPDPELAERIARERALTAPLGATALATPRLFDQPFVAPSDGPVASVFGEARTFNGAVRSRHWGVDLDGETGDAVRASNRGVVMLTGEFFYSGGTTYVNHGGGVITAYFHQSEILVSAGDTVAAGQLIGRVGATGRVTGPHLHWLVRVGNRPVDGTSLLGLPVPRRASTDTP